jgi:MFS family permease
VGGRYRPQGYVLGMTPSGVLCRIFGAKNVLSVGLLGNAAAMALLPFVVVRGVYPTSALLVIKGLCQSCLESTHTTLKRCWMPQCLGAERVWAVRVTRWGQFLGQMAASLVTPWLASSFGWRAVPLSFGGATALYTLVWHAAAAETPMQWRGTMSVPEKQLLLESDEMKSTVAAAADGASSSAIDGPAKPSSGGGGSGFPFHLLRYPSCVVPMMLHVGNNCSQYTLQYWGPTMLVDMFASSPQQQGNIIFAATLSSVIGSFAVAGFENLMLVSQVTSRSMGHYI